MFFPVSDAASVAGQWLAAGVLTMADVFGMPLAVLAVSVISVIYTTANVGHGVLWLCVRLRAAAAGCEWSASSGSAFCRGGGEGVEALRAATLARIPHRRRRRQQQQQVALVLGGGPVLGIAATPAELRAAATAEGAATGEHSRWSWCAALPHRRRVARARPRRAPRALPRASAAGAAAEAGVERAAAGERSRWRRRSAPPAARW